MKAGRELDALVSEKVMNTEKYWAVMFSGSHYGNFATIEKAESCAAKIQGEFKAHIIPCYDEPHYSTDIAAAWEVVEKLRAYGLDISMQALDEGDGTWWSACIGDCMADAQTAPLAICLAALKTVSTSLDPYNESDTLP